MKRELQAIFQDKNTSLEEKNGQIKTLIADSTMVVDLCDICDDLWNKYFMEKLSNEEKKIVRDLYNLSAKAANKNAGRDIQQIITASTKWVPKKEEATGKPLPRITPAHAGTITEKPRVGKESDAPAKPKKQNGEGGGIIDQILALHKKGLSNKEIIAEGYNKSTVNRQVSEYKKRIQNG